MQVRRNFATVWKSRSSVPESIENHLIDKIARSPLHQIHAHTPYTLGDAIILKSYHTLFEHKSKNPLGTEGSDKHSVQ